MYWEQMLSDIPDPSVQYVYGMIAHTCRVCMHAYICMYCMYDCTDCVVEESSGVYHTHMCPHVPICTHMYPNAPTWTHMYPHAPTCTQMHPHGPTCTHMHPHVPTFIHMYPNTPICTYSTYVCCVRTYIRRSTSFPMMTPEMLAVEDDGETTSKRYVHINIHWIRAFLYCFLHSITA